MASSYEIRYNDSTKGKNGKPEGANMRIRVTTLTAANLAAQQALLATLLSATQAISLGLLAKETIVLSETFSNAGFATSPQAQRENKWLVSMEDTTTHRVESFTVPCCDLTLLPSTHEETMDLSAGPGLAFKNAVEAVYRSINDHACVMQSVKFVGRSL